MFIVNDGLDKKAEILTSAITDAVDYLSTEFPKFQDHLMGLKAVKVADSLGENTLGLYRPYYGEIQISAELCKTEEQAISTFIHEVGHHVAMMRHGISSNYDSKNGNKDYFREEIKADGYCLNILKRFFSGKGFSEAIEARKARISEAFRMLQKLAKSGRTSISAMQAATYNWSYTNYTTYRAKSNYTTVSGTVRSSESYATTTSGTMTWTTYSPVSTTGSYSVSWNSSNLAFAA